MFELKKILNILAIITTLMLIYTVSTISLVDAQEKEPPKGIKIMLSVYSGRPNPQWWLTEGPEFEKLILLLKELKTEDKELFKYDEWNRLGYASFWIVPKNISDLPYSLHIWRDKAVVAQTKVEKLRYAIGVTIIYDILVDQAIARGQKTFFTNYLKFKSEKEKDEREKQNK